MTNKTDLVEIGILTKPHGLKGEITVNDQVYDGVMANQGLDNEEIADVMNYILNQWGNSTTVFITNQQVQAVPKSKLE